MDGLDCIRELRQWESNNRSFQQHVVGISAHANDKDAEHGIVLGMNSYRAKPLKLKDLEDIASSDEVVSMSKALDDMVRTKIDQRICFADPKHQEACLIATDASMEHTVTNTVEESGWMPVTASSKSELLDKLRSRNWDAVLLDGDVPDFSTCVQEFREWESCNRVRKQRNLFMLSSGFDDIAPSALSLLELPSGVDGVIGKPTTSLEVKKMLKSARCAGDSLSFTADDIVTR